MASPSIFVRFPFLCTFPPFHPDFSPKLSLINSPVFLIQWPFVPRCQEGPSLSVISQIGNCADRKFPFEEEGGEAELSGTSRLQFP